MPCGAVAGGQECLEAPQSILGTNLWEAGWSPVSPRLGSELTTANHVSYCPLS